MGFDAIVSRLKAIRDPRMRVLVLIEALGEGDPTSWVHTLATIVTRAHQHSDADAAEALHALTQATADPQLAYAIRQRLYEAARREELSAIARLFIEASPRTMEARQLAKSMAPERVLKPRGRPLTLGERKALARTHDREEIMLLTRDPHPAVVAILLDNPHVIEADVVKIASTRPMVPESLAKIAAHNKWSVRHPVRRALVLNPSTPLAIAIRIATTLRGQELDELAADPSLPELLRKHAADVRRAQDPLREPETN